MENIWQKKNYNFDKRLNEKFPEMEEDFNYRKGVCKEIFNKMKNIYVPIANEFIVYDQENGICRYDRHDPVTTQRKTVILLLTGKQVRSLKLATNGLTI